MSSPVLTHTQTHTHTIYLSIILLQAYEWYEKGEALGFFLSKDQRSLYNVEELTGRAWWTKKQTGQQQLIQVILSFI